MVEHLPRLRPFIPTALLRLAYRWGIHVMRVYWWLARPRTSGVKCVVRCGERYLLVRHTYGERHWDLPGGTAHRDEDPRATAVRELHEELGVRPVAMQLLHTVQWHGSGKRDSVSLFVVDLDGESLDVDAAEIAAVCWVTANALPPGTSRLARALIARSRWPVSVSRGGAELPKT